MPERQTETEPQWVWLRLRGPSLLFRRLFLGQRSHWILQDACSSHAKSVRVVLLRRRTPMDYLGSARDDAGQMAVVLDNPEEVTTYSWRRVAPTLAQLIPSEQTWGASCPWRLAEQRGHPRGGATLFLGEVRGLHQDQVCGLGRCFNVDRPALVGGDPTGGVGQG